MRGGPSLRGLAGCAAALAVALGAAPAQAGADAAVALRRLVSAMDAPALRDRAAVERQLGATLALRGENDSFRHWRVEAAGASGLAVREVDYRQPRPGSSATAGPLLALTIAPEPCLDRRTVQAAFPDLRLTDVATHDVPDAKAYWSRQVPGGRLSLGFPVRGPDCLRSVVLSLDDP